MSHTYGEVLDKSFPDIFGFVSDPATTVFVDAGSGYGALLFAAVREYGCKHAIGIEKYKDKYLASLELVGQLPQDLKRRITIKQQDINDTELRPLLDTITCQTLLFFCNNVAFNSGTNHRYVHVYSLVHPIMQLLVSTLWRVHLRLSAQPTTSCRLPGLDPKSVLSYMICMLRARNVSS